MADVKYARAKRQSALGVKKTVSLFIAVMIALSFAACENKSKSNKTEQQNIEQMVLNEKYTLNVGDEIKKLSDDAKVTISQNSESDSADYVLVEGEAEILRR